MRPTVGLDRTWQKAFGRNLITEPLQLAARAHDASHYLLTPAAIIEAQNATQVAQAMRLARASGIGLTFRSGGTSLSGQAGGAGIMVDVRRAFTGIDVTGDGSRVSCGPGVTIRAVNQALAPYGRTLGPDPASAIAATVGGVVANNSSGMTCGTAFNTYQTLAAISLTLPSGTHLDTARPDAAVQLAEQEPALCAGLVKLRDRIRRNPDSLRRIAHQYSMKNTMGYGLNSFTDFDEPLDILTHLMVGSEGTLGFISKVVFETLPVEPHTATALLVFARLEDATDSLESLIDAGAKTLELMDPAAIAAARAAVGVGGGAGNSRDPLGQVTAPTQTALLVESRASDQDELVDRAEALRRTLSGLRLASPVAFATSSTERDRLWMARNGLYTAVAGARPRGSTALLEDIAVPVARLSQTCAGLADLFAQHGFADSVIFGHAKDGNIHFMLTLDLDQAEQLNRLEDFTENMVDLVLAEGGTLKAEHGTGRVMAPFVRHQFGDELYEVQCQIKRLFDPDGVLAPGVLISDDQRGHMAHIKTMPRVDRAFDDCVECGYCEPSCPALNLTLSPRGRIAALRTIATLPPRNKRAAERLFAYDGVDTCAADSLCVIACPVGIDTGKLMKTQRSLRHSPAVQAAGALVARHWGGAVELLRAALVAASAIPGPVLAAITKTARTVLPKDWIPLAGNDLPGPGTRRRGGVVGDQAGPVSGAYFPSCVNSLFAPAPGGPGVGAALDQLCRAAGIALLVPKPIGSLCCGTVWESKGLTAGANAMARMTFDALWQASGGGALPVVCDAASCSHGLQALADRLDETRAERASRLRVVDSVSFVLNEVVPRLRIDRVLGGIAVHPTCSTVQLGAKDDLIALAGLVAKTVFVPPTWGCCAFAGDRGMLHPELTKAATRPEAEAVWAAEAEPGRFDAYVSANRTCELGISRATGRIYRHVLEVLAANSHAL